ncbi:hypothetical protein PUN28_018985 [Cardiocondyla obscurior]|uniref:Nose resistant-to-fluoxetine protein N-terminal domain-containing protein n=1 Tax=Cardiocondyla obscurior TaxID=286306 RepID=A0AAW2ECW0_9HYME
MERTRFGWWVSLSVLLAVAGIDGTRPEVVLTDVLTKPFVPREFASSRCIRDGEIYLEALERYTPWALQMFDASVKIPSGVITGNYRQLGNFDECLRVKNEHGFVGQACNAVVQFEINANDNAQRRELDLGDLLVNIAIASNATKWNSGNSVEYEWMFCVPSTCNHTEIREALEIALDPLKVEGRIDMTINVPKESCHTVETVQTTWDVADWCYTSIVALFAFIIIASTGYDIMMQWRDSTTKSRDLFTAFSLYKNGKELFRTDRRRGSIHCLDGLRFISICWIIYGHTHYMEAVSVKMDLTQIPHMHNDWNNMLVLNGNIVTDTFFLLSGALLAYTELSKKERAAKWRFDMIGLYIHRYVRLTPAYAMMIGFYATLFDKFGTGPHWDTWVGSNKNFCRENWWANLLYVNNYVNVPNTMDLSQVYLEIYIKTYNRFGAYVIGLGLGYLLYKTRSYKVKLHTCYATLGWLIAIMAGLSVIFGPRGMYLDTHVYNRLEASFYAGFHRQVFVLSVSWIIFCCMHGYAGPVNYLLSWRGWIPLSKLTYCAYLSHYLFILSHVGAVRTTGNLTQMNVMRAFFANLVFTMMVSVLWSLCFEVPFMKIDSILLSGRKRNLSKHLSKGYGSTASGKEICQSKEFSVTYDNPDECDVSRYDFVRNASGNGENGAYVDDEANRNKIFFISPIKHDETWPAVNSDNRRADHVNVDLCHDFDKRRESMPSTSRLKSDPTGSDPARNAEPNRSLRDTA